MSLRNLRSSGQPRTTRRQSREGSALPYAPTFLFADSTDLLPDHLFRQMIAKPENFGRKLRQLFAAMASEGSTFGPHDIHYFNGGLFADDEVFELTLADLAILKSAAAIDLVNNRTSNLRHTF